VIQVPEAGPEVSAQEKRRLLAALLEKKAAAGQHLSPLSAGQKALWFLRQQAPASAAYHVPFAVRIRARVDRAALRRAFEALIDRHPSLRTTFEASPSGLLLQTAHRRGELSLREVDAAGESPEALQDRLSRSWREPFDLRRGPLMRVDLFTLAEADHVLLIALHHIVFDGWSSWILQRELRELYLAFAQGAQPSLAALPATYADFVARQSAMVAGPEGEAHWAFWRRQLEGDLPALSLPFDKPRPSTPAGRSGAAPVELTPEVTSALKALAKEEQATPFAVLLAGYQVLLGRLSGQCDVLVGSPTAGRDRPEHRPLIGYFANPVVLRADLDPALSFRAHLRRTRGAVLDALAHQAFPFSTLVERLQPERRGSVSPLFQASMVYQQPTEAGGGMELWDAGEGRGRIRWGDVEVEPFALRDTPSPFDLSLEMWEVRERFRGALRYDADLLEAETVRRWVSYLRVLLGEAAADSDRRLGELALEKERSEIGNAPRPAEAAAQARWPAGATLATAFEARVALAPGATAVACEGERLTYAELDARANQLAHRLRAQDVGPGARVGLCLERSLDMVVAILGVLKAGGAYVPFDPSSPAERLQGMLEDAGLSLLLADGAGAAALPPGAAPLLLDGGAWREGQPTSAFACPAAPDDAAYVIYTSGSTGRPKGVVVEHRQVMALMRGTLGLFDFGPGDVWTLFHSYAFDFSVWELWGALLYGGRLVVVPRGVTRAPDAFARLLADEGVTVLNQTPSAFRALLREGAFAREGGAHRLRWIIFGGEALEPAGLRPWFERHGGRGTRLVNMYGITETTVHVTYHEVTEKDLASAGSNVGVALPHLRVYLLDERGEEVPVGVPGEIWVGGEGVARGYLDRPELTAQRFVPDRFLGPPRRLYRSGDLASRQPDGSLRYLGRIDHQVKIRGHRIELGEIQAALGRHPAVAESIVVPYDRAEDDRLLVAYVVPKPTSELAPAEAAAEHFARPSPIQPEGAAGASAAGASDDPMRGHRWRGLKSELRRLAQDSLPDYMVPASIELLERLPMTGNGKLDRRALPPPELQRDASTDLVAPRDPREEVLAAIFQEVLGIDRVGIHDGFFDLGGHSLLATQVVSRVHKALGADLSLHAFFEAPTVAGVAARLGRDGAVDGAASPPLVPAPRDGGELPLSYAQERLWILERLEERRIPLYNLPVALRLQGPLDARALGESLARIAERHETLRTRFPERDGKPRQAIDSEPLTLPEVEDLSGVAADEAGRLMRARDLIGLEALRPFDLGAGPLLRARLFRLGARDHVLSLALHHIAADGWSLGVLMRELSALYGALRRGEEPALSPLPVQYADYALWQRRWLSGAALDAEVAHWRERLQGAPEGLELPADRPRPALPSFRGATVRFSLGAALTARLKETARRAGATLSMALLSGFAAYLSRISGQEDLVVGTPVANRQRLETEGLIGFFVNTLCLRLDLSGDPDFAKLLDRVRSAALDAYAHQDLPFEKLVEALAPRRRLDRSPLFQVMFVLQNAPFAPPRLDELEVSGVALDSVTSKFDLTLSMEDGPDGLTGVLEYARDLFDAERIEAMARHLAALFRALAEDPHQPVSRAPMLAPDERARLLESARGASSDPGPGEALSAHRLFEAWARKDPSATAMAAPEGPVSYGELDLRASRIAGALRARGIARGDLVALSAPRSPEAIAGILGIWKAGAAYVPLDPSYPAARLTFMAEDSRAKALLAPEALRPRWEGRFGSFVALEEALAGPALQRPSEVGPADLAYVLYTSGSTGQPKGVLIEHRGLPAIAGVQREILGVGPGSRVLQFASLSFDASVWEIVGALGNGAALHLEPATTLLAADALAEVLRRGAITHALLPPSSLRALPEGSYPALRALVSGGEACTAELVERWARGGARFFNAYGPTEVTIAATLGECRPGEGTPPIGRPLPLAECYVVDRRLELVPDGTPGELLAGGAGLARGYLNREALTAERFVAHPFRPGAKLYRTGDRVRRRRDGALEYLGRIDHQLKIRGFRIEPEEVEAALLATGRFEQVAVAEASGGLAAFVVLRGGAALDASSLRAELGERLPEHLVPGRFAALPSLPLTANGKVDRRQLPALSPAEAGEAYAAPRDPTEAALAEVFAQVLRRDRVGVHDNFFALGGDSISSMQIVARAAQRGLRLRPRQLFQHQTIAALARQVGRGGAAAEQGLAAGEVPLTPIQRWFFEQGRADPHHFNQAVLLEAEGALDAAALREALAAVERQHDALRLRFRRDGETWRQEHAEPRGIPLEEVDLAGRGPEDLRAAIESHGERAQAGLELSRGPVVRAVLFRLGRASRLLLAAHHLVVDGVSWPILLEDLFTAYGQLSSRSPVALPPKTTSFQAYAERLRAHAGSPAVSAELDAWLAQGGEPAPLPVDDPGGPDTVGEAARLWTRLDPEATRRLLATAPAALNARPQEILLAALARALSAQTGRSAIRIDLEGHGRESPFEDVDLTRTVGWFTALYPVLLRLDPAKGSLDALARAKEAARRIPQGGLGFGLLRYLSADPAVAERMARLPRAPVAFNYLGQVGGAVGPGIRVLGSGGGSPHSPRARRPHRLEVNAAVIDGALQVEWTYGSRAFREATIRGVAQAFERCLDELSRSQGAALTAADFPAARMSPAQLGKVLAKVRGPRSPGG
jgi:amino acid adenylation domain-containing protein/non-ribosomal peptide synthase protein (TIGR01720 family)